MDDVISASLSNAMHPEELRPPSFGLLTEELAIIFWLPSERKLGLSGIRLLFGRQNLLNTYLIDQVLSTYVGKMRSLLVVCQICPNSLGHRQYKRAIWHV
jgi:hypothetical protein